MKKGVYEVQWGSQQIRIIVLSEVPRVERNALWLLFSGILEHVQYGVSHYRWRRNDLSTVLNNLFEFYQVEGLTMPYTVEDYKRDLKEEVLAKLTPEERLRGLSVEEILRELQLEELLKRLSPEKRLTGLPPEERLKGLTREQIEAYLKKLSASN